MNILTLLLTLSLCTICPLHARSDCLDNSWHLQKKFDNKEYHTVAECLCPCTTVTSDRNQCTRCSHFHDAKPWVFISSQPKSAQISSLSLRKHDLRKTLVSLIKRYHKAE